MAAPVNSVLPYIAWEGNFVASPGAWDPPTPTLAYQWQISVDDETWSNISGATSSSYASVSGDIGNYLRVVVTATNDDGSTAVESISIGPILADPALPTTSSTLTISGTAAVGETITASTPSWTGEPSLYYEWLYWDTETETWASFDFGQSLTLTSSEEGLLFTVQCVATNYLGEIAIICESPVTIGTVDFTITTPTISGSTSIGSTITASVSSTGGESTVSYLYLWRKYDGETYLTPFSTIGEVVPTGTYTTDELDNDLSISVDVYATNDSGTRFARSALFGPITEGSTPDPPSLTPPTEGLIFWKPYYGS